MLNIRHLVHCVIVFLFMFLSLLEYDKCILGIFPHFVLHLNTSLYNIRNDWFIPQPIVNISKT